MNEELPYLVLIPLPLCSVESLCARYRSVSFSVGHSTPSVYPEFFYSKDLTCRHSMALRAADLSGTEKCLILKSILTGTLR